MQSEFHLQPPTNPRRLKIAAIAAIVVAGGVVAAGTLARVSDRHTAQHWSDATSVPIVHLVPVTAPPVTDGLTLPGTMQAWNTAKIFAQTNGYVKAWYKDIGAHVSAGTVLGLVETPEVDQQIAQARAELARARADAALAHSTAARWNDLLSDNSVSHQDADEKNNALADRKAGVQAAQANLDRLLAMKGFASLRAPFAGIVTARSADIGNLVGPSGDNHQPLFAIADTHAIRIYVNVPQAYANSVKQGLAVTLTVPDDPGRTFTAKLIGDAGAIDPQTGNFEVQLLTDNADHALRPGGYAQVKFAVPSQSGTVLIPSSTLVFRAANTQVATIGPDNRVRMHTITIGQDQGNAIEVTSGLTRGEKIVDNPPDSIAEGELVRVAGGHNG